MRTLLGSAVFCCWLGAAFADPVAWWRFEGTPGVKTVEGDTFTNSVTGADALPALAARSISGKTYGYSETYMPRYTNAFSTGYVIYDPVTGRSHANASSLSLRDTLTETDNKNNGVATMPGDAFPTTGNVTIECFYRAPFLDAEGKNVTTNNREMVPIVMLPTAAYTYSFNISLYNKNNRREFYFGYSTRDANGEKNAATGSSYGTYVADDKWHHVAQVFDFTAKQLRCYADYACVATIDLKSDAVGVYVTGTNNLIVGGTDLLAARKFQGHVDEVRISTDALEPTQFLRMKPEAIPSDVLAHVTFETPAWWGGNGLPVAATAANFSHPFVSSTEKAADPLVVTPDAAVIYDGVDDPTGTSNAAAFDLNRTDAKKGSVLTLDYLTADTLLGDVPEFTLEFFARFKNASQVQYYPIVNDGQYTFRWYFSGPVDDVCDGSKLMCGVGVVTNANGSSATVNVGTGAMSPGVCDGAWHHFALRFSTKQKLVTIDVDRGRLAHASAVLPSEALGFFGNSRQLVFGGRVAGERLVDMEVDEIRVTRRVLEEWEFLNTRHLSDATRAWVRFENDWTIGPDLGVGRLTLTPTKASGTTTDPAFKPNTARPLLLTTATAEPIANAASASLVNRAMVKSDDWPLLRDLRNATYEAFVKVNAISNALDASKMTHVVCFGKSSQNPDVGLRLVRYNETSRSALVAWRKGADARDTMTVDAFDDGRWHHHAITVSETTNATSGAVSTTVTYYRDYEQKAQKTVGYARVMSTVAEQTKILVGDSWGSGHDYEIDEIRVSAGVLGTSAFMRRKGLGCIIIFR